MRKSSVRTLRQENNARERALSRESQREMTDVVVYLRGQDLSPLDQEEIRRDILEMVWEAEARGRPWPKWWGRTTGPLPGDCSCGARRSRRVRMAAAVEELLPALSVLLGIWLVKKVVEALLRGGRDAPHPDAGGRRSPWGSAGGLCGDCDLSLPDCFGGERGRSWGKKGVFMAWAFCVALLAAIFCPLSC